jgi:hypothetical protein
MLGAISSVEAAGTFWATKEVHQMAIHAQRTLPDMLLWLAGLDKGYCTWNIRGEKHSHPAQRYDCTAYN